MKLKTSAYLAIFLAFTITFAAFAPVSSNAYQAAQESSELLHVVCRKTESLEVSYAPTGKLLEKSVYVRFEIYNNNSSPAHVRIVDRVACINSSTLTFLYGTPQPATVETFGNLTRIVWENVTIDARKTIRYYYTAESLKKAPLAVNMSLRVHGEPARITEAEGIYFTNANISDTVSLQLRINNTLQPLYVANNRTAIQPLLCTVSLALSNDYFSGIKTSPKANTTSTMADKTVITWITFLGNVSKTLEASADIIDVGSWGEVTLDPIVIQASSSSEMLETYFTNAVNNLDFSIELMESFAASSEELCNQTSQMGRALEGIANATEEMSENTTLLVDSLMLVASSIEMADNMLNTSQTCLLLANSSLAQFMSDSETMGFLASHPELAVYLNHTVGNLTLAYTYIDWVRNGYEYGGETIPGLSEIADTLYGIAEAVNLTGTVTQNLTGQLNGLAQALYLISDSANQTKMELAPTLNQLKTEKASLEDVLLTFNSKTVVPFNLEIQPQSAEPQPLEILEENIAIEQLDANLWAVTAINASNLADHSQIAYCLSIQIKNGTANLEPKAEVYVNGEWQPAEKTLLGLQYDRHGGILYLSPWKKLNVSSSANLLVDWAGRPVRLTVPSQAKPDVEIKEVDYAELYENVEITATEGQTECSIIQPHIVIKNVTAPKPPPPPPQPEKTLMEILMEYMQKPEVWLLLLLAVVLAAVLFKAAKKAKKKRQAKLWREKTGETEKADVEELLKEIEAIERALSS